MPTLSTAARNAACNAIVDLLDVGSTNAAGQIVFETSGNAEVATLPLSNPGFGAAATGTATASAITSDTNATGGTIDHASIQDRNEAEVILATCGTSGADINLSSLVIGAGDTVSMSSLTVTQPAS